MYFQYIISWLSPLWERVWTFISTNLNNSSFKDALCQVWIKLTQCFWRRRVLNFFNIFSLFRNNSPLGKSMALHLKKTIISSPTDALCKVWLKLAQWFWRRRWNCEKFTERQMDDRRSEKLTWAFNSGELKIQAQSHDDNSIILEVHK